MFDCQKTREFMDLYLDNELESVPTKHVAEHLEKCAECHREFEMMRSQNELLARSIKNQQCDTTKLSSEIEAATIGKTAIRLPQLSLPRLPMWVLAMSCILIVALSALFYLPGRMGTALAHPLYQAAATDHRACSADSAASDWIRSQADINELATSFFNQKQKVPPMVGGEYRLVRARICNFDGLRFLHLVYETTDGRHVSLFGRNATDLPPGELMETVNGRNLQLTYVAGLAVFGASDGVRQLFAASPDDGVARSALLGFLDS